MTPTPFDKIGLRWRDHKTALWWLGLLYRRPAQFENALQDLPRIRVLKAGILLYLHALPYVVLFCILGRFVISDWLEFPIKGRLIPTPDISQYNVFQIVLIGITWGLVLAIIIGFRHGIDRIAKGTTIGIITAIICGIVGSIDFMIALVIVVLINRWFGYVDEEMMGIGVIIILGIIGGALLMIIVGIDKGIKVGIASGSICIIFLLRVYYHPLFWWLAWPKPFGRLYPLHPVAWDDKCIVPFLGLDRLLVAYAEFMPEEGMREIDRIIESYPSQWRAALRAKTTLLARQTARVKDLTKLEALVAQLPEGTGGFFAETARLRIKISEITKMQIRLDTITRPIQREPLAQVLYEKIENFRHQIAGFHEPLASEFRKAAKNWLAVAERQLHEAQAILAKEPSPAVFRAGVQVNGNTSLPSASERFSRCRMTRPFTPRCVAACWWKKRMASGACACRSWRGGSKSAVNNATCKLATCQLAC
jgi:hypothetical protein